MDFKTWLKKEPDDFVVIGKTPVLLDLSEEKKRFERELAQAVQEGKEQAI
jgi:hypothetical protein